MNIRIARRFLMVLTLVGLFHATAFQPVVDAAPVSQGESANETGQAYTVRPGDSLYKISVTYLGSGALWPQIQEASNAKAAIDDSFAAIDQPSLIRAGQKIWIPVAADDQEMAETPNDDTDDAGSSDLKADGDDADGMSDDRMASDGEAEDAGTDTAMQSLAEASTQLKAAASHYGFLNDSLAADDLAMAQTHAEHVINILDGEDGRYFGDINRDGKTQNPGDGIGVRGHLERSVEEVDISGEGLDWVVQAIETAGKLQAADSASEAVTVADDLGALLDQLASFIDDSQSVDTGLAGEGSGDAEMADDEAAGGSEEMDDDGQSDPISSDGDGTGSTVDSISQLATVLAEQEWQDALATANAQAALAVNHYDFLQGSLDADDLAMALVHTEHVINILDGEDGLLFGDSNRDGKTQNPGDGVGVRVYLTDAGDQLLDLLGLTADDVNATDDVKALLTAIEGGQGAASESADSAIQLFSADNADEAGLMADALGQGLAELQASITAAMDTVAGLQP